MWKLCLPQKFHTRKLGEITVFYAVIYFNIAEYWKTLDALTAKNIPRYGVSVTRIFPYKDRIVETFLKRRLNMDR